MRPILILCFCALLLNGSCKKEHASSHTTGSDSLVGKWHVVLITGGIDGIHQTAAEWGHYASHTFRADSTCTNVYDHDTTNESYHIWTDTSYGYSQRVISIGTQMPLDLTMTHDTLVLGLHNTMDAFVEWYVKE